MPRTLEKTTDGVRIIGATFTDSTNADRAVEALEAYGVSPINIQVVVQLNSNAVGDLYASVLTDRGFTPDDAKYFDKLIRAGRTLVAVYDVVEPGPVIDILDHHQAEFNPDGSRNIRDDVVGMTTGAVLGAAILGTVGGAVAGSGGIAAGAAAGAVLGGGSGAAIGKAAEHRK